MAQIRQPGQVKLIVALLAGGSEWLDAAVQRLEGLFGPVDLLSPDWPFTFTDYYAAQMGEALIRRLVAFERLIDPGTLAAIKLQTNELEAELARRFSGPARPVNLDSGYVAPGKLILASAKDFAHRVYLGQGIYAEVTLQYVGGQWKRLPFTFPDYASGLYDAFLSAARKRLMDQTKAGGRSLEAGGA